MVPKGWCRINTPEVSKGLFSANVWCRINTPEQLMVHVRAGNFNEEQLLPLLTDSAQKEYEDHKKMCKDELANQTYTIDKEITKLVDSENSKNETESLRDNEMSSWRLFWSEFLSFFIWYPAYHRYQKMRKMHDDACDAAARESSRKINEADKQANELIAQNYNRYEELLPRTWLKLFENSENRIEVWR